MTVIAWDGKTLAADKMASNGGSKFRVTKIWRIKKCLIGVCGDYAPSMAVKRWFEQGANPKDWPECNQDKDCWAALLVIDPQKQIWRYEREPYPFKIEEPFFAVGCGKEAAMAAMHMGASAKKAVKIAALVSPECGLGVDTLEYSV